MKDKIWSNISGFFGLCCLVAIGGVISKWGESVPGVLLSGVGVWIFGWLAWKCSELSEPQYVKTGDRLIGVRQKQFRRKKWYEKL